jgi:hypothetical protein
MSTDQIFALGVYDAYARSLPSRDTPMPWAFNPEVKRVGSLSRAPSAASRTLNTSRPPSRLETKRSVRLSGSHAGLTLRNSPVVI